MDYNSTVIPKLDDLAAALQDLKDRGLIQDYALAGAMAALFWDEVIPTFDWDVLVLLGPVENQLAPLAGIYEWARERGYKIQDEHIYVADLPVQFMPAPEGLATEAIAAATLKDGLKVVRPEYLIALWRQPPANSLRRRERAAKLNELPEIDHDLLKDLQGRYKL